MTEEVLVVVGSCDDASCFADMISWINSQIVRFVSDFVHVGSCDGRPDGRSRSKLETSATAIAEVEPETIC